MAVTLSSNECELGPRSLQVALTDSFAAAVPLPVENYSPTVCMEVRPALLEAAVTRLNLPFLIWPNSINTRPTNSEVMAVNRFIR
jgi:hypothetical protein